MFGQILLAVVAVAVTVISSGALAGAFGLVGGGISGGIAAATSIAGGGLIGAVAGAGVTLGSAAGLVAVSAAGAAVGSIASQGVGVALKIQDKFSWKAVGLAAIGGGVGAGLGVAAGLDKLGVVGSALKNSFIRGATSSIIGQGIGVATGLQSKFSWTSVAAAGVGNVAGAQFGGLAATAARTIANAGTRSLIDGTNFGDNVLAALPDVIGQTIGNAIIGNISFGAGGDGDSGGISFNFKTAISDTVGLVAGLPQGITDGLADMRTDVVAGLRALAAKVEAGFNENQAKTIARGHARTNAKFDEVAVTAMRQKAFRYAFNDYKDTRSKQASYRKQRNINNIDNFHAGVDFVMARESARARREHRDYLANHDGFIAEDFNADRWLALKSLDMVTANAGTWLNGITTSANELYNNGKSTTMESSWVDPETGMRLWGKRPAHLMTDDWTYAVGMGSTMLTGAAGSIGLGGLRQGFGSGKPAPVQRRSVKAINRQPVKGSVEKANFAQNNKGKQISASKPFSDEGIAKYSKIAGQRIETVGDLRDAFKRGTIKPSQIPIDYIILNGNKLILNTRTSTALHMANIPKSAWYGINRSGQTSFFSNGQAISFNQNAYRQLFRNDLPLTGAPNLPGF